jgi:hypothetical protein
MAAVSAVAASATPRPAFLSMVFMSNLLLQLARFPHGIDNAEGASLLQGIYESL